MLGTGVSEQARGNWFQFLQSRWELGVGAGSHAAAWLHWDGKRCLVENQGGRRGRIPDPKVQLWGGSGALGEAREEEEEKCSTDRGVL